MDLVVFLTGGISLLFGCLSAHSFMKGLKSSVERLKIDKELSKIKEFKDSDAINHNSLSQQLTLTKQSSIYVQTEQLHSFQPQSPIRLLKDGVFDGHQQYKVVGMPHSEQMFVTIGKQTLVKTIRMQFDETVILKDCMRMKQTPQTPTYQSTWYSIISLFNIRNKQIRHSPVQTQITLDLSKLSIFGHINLEQINVDNLVIKVKYLARNFSTLISYLEQLHTQKLKQLITSSCFTSMFMLLSHQFYKFAKRQYDGNVLMRERRDKQGHPTKLSHIKHVDVHKRDRLMCYRCQKTVVNVVFECGHMNICQNCLMEKDRCKQCGLKTENPVKIFIS